MDIISIDSMYIYVQINKCSRRHYNAIRTISIRINNIHRNPITVNYDVSQTKRYNMSLQVGDRVWSPKDKIGVVKAIKFNIIVVEFHGALLKTFNATTLESMYSAFEMWLNDGNIEQYKITPFRPKIKGLKYV